MCPINDPIKINVEEEPTPADLAKALKWGKQNYNWTFIHGTKENTSLICVLLKDLSVDNVGMRIKLLFDILFLV